MPFVADRRLEDLINPDAVAPAGRAMTDKAGDHLRDATKLRTPISTDFTGGLPRHRRRGTARESVVRGPVRRHTSVLGRGWEVKAYSEDPVFPYIEWNTRPHEIAPTAEHRARAAAEGHQAALRFYSRGSVRFAVRVMHPGTTGQHPFARGAAWLAVEFPFLVEDELRAFARDLTSGRAGRVIDRTGRGSAGAELDQAIAAFMRAHAVPIAGSGQRGVNDLLGG